MSVIGKSARMFALLLAMSLSAWEATALADPSGAPTGPVVWDGASPLYPPCNQTGQTNYGFFGACEGSSEESSYFRRAHAHLRERTKRLVDGYYAGKLLSFNQFDDERPFPGPVCDISTNADEETQASCGNYCSIAEEPVQVWVTESRTEPNAAACGQDCQGEGEEQTCTPRTCTFNVRVAAERKAFYANVASCDRELSYVRGAWLRSVSVNWLKVIDELKNQRRISVVSIDQATRDKLQGQLTETTPCHRLAEEFVKTRNRVHNSKIFQFWPNIRPEECTAGSGGDRTQAACHLKEARAALENMYTYLLACAQFSHAMMDMTKFMIVGNPSTFQIVLPNLASGDGTPQAVTVTVIQTALRSVFEEVKSECDSWIRNDVEPDRSRVALYAGKCYRWDPGENYRNKGGFTRKFKARVLAGGSDPYGWGGEHCRYCDRFPLSTGAAGY